VSSERKGWSLSARWADSLVGWIARRKLELLACSIGLAAALGVVACVLWLAGDGPELNRFLLDAGGYVATAALVLGLPALAYAMVTDRTVDALTASARGRLREEVRVLLDKARQSLHHDAYEVQLFQPNQTRTRLVPAYDPSNTGPQEGWDINPRAPQAVTGSAWVDNSYYFLQEPALSKSGLRLTEEQQRRYKGLTGVAATPVRDAAGHAIAVLTLFSTSAAPKMDTKDFVDRHVGLAADVGEILRAYIGPLDFDTVTVAQADEETLDKGRIDITPQVVEAARRSEAFDELQRDINNASSTPTGLDVTNSADDGQVGVTTKDLAHETSTGSQPVAPSHGASNRPNSAFRDVIRARVLATLADGEARTAPQIATSTQYGFTRVRDTLVQLAQTGEVDRTARGYQIRRTPPPE
jgi:hypothetical protein